MKKIYQILPSVFLLTACSTTKGPEKNEQLVWKQNHEQVIEELDLRNKRTPASVSNDLKVNFGDLRKISPGKFEVYVFPKVNKQNHKMIEEDEEYLGPPKKFDVSIVAVNQCRNFISGGQFAKLKPVHAFRVELDKTSRDCAIIEMRDARLKTVDKAFLKKDDELSVRLFIDDMYGVNAIDQEFYEGPNATRIVRRVYEEDNYLSGLSYYPTLLPTLLATKSESNLNSGFNKIDPIAEYQVQDRYNLKFKKTDCRGTLTSERDPLGGQIKTGWCEGMPWPVYTENSRFISVTQNLSVR